MVQARVELFHRDAFGKCMHNHVIVKLCLALIHQADHGGIEIVLNREHRCTFGLVGGVLNFLPKAAHKWGVGQGRAICCPRGDAPWGKHRAAFYKSFNPVSPNSHLT
jgi:hypothetical protein